MAKQSSPSRVLFRMFSLKTETTSASYDGVTTDHSAASRVDLENRVASHPSEPLADNTKALIRTLHQQQHELAQVTKHNIELEARLSQMESVLKTLHREQLEGDRLISSLVDIVASGKEKGSASRPGDEGMYKKLKVLKERLERLVERQKTEDVRE